MVASDDDRRANFALPHKIVEKHSGLFALAVTEPADSGRKALERNPSLSHLKPAREPLVLGEKLEQRPVRHLNVLGVARQRHPAERTAAFAELRSNVSGNEAGEIKRVPDSGFDGLSADIVPVVENVAALLL